MGSRLRGDSVPLPAFAGTGLRERGLALCAAVLCGLCGDAETGDQARGKGIWWMPWH
jgi:hypothetical protein